MFSAVESIVAVPNHQLESRTLDVQVYYDCLGLTPPCHDTTNTDGWIPESTMVTGFNPSVFTYLLISPEMREMVDTKMAAVAAVVEWETYNDTSSSIELRCTLSHKMKGVCQLAKMWDKTAIRTFMQVTKSFQEVLNSELVCEQAWV